MTKVRFHGPIAGFSGAMGEMVFADIRAKNKTVAYMKKHYPPTELQLSQRTRFKEAALHAKAALENPGLRAFYETIAEQRDSNSYAVALTDFLVTPSFKPLDLRKYKGQIGDIITILAVDDIGMANVNVDISAQDGTPIEAGPAVEDGIRTGYWIYTATRQVALGSGVFIDISGCDHAGTKALLTENSNVGEDEVDSQ
jgi:hypothetical protein